MNVRRRSGFLLVDACTGLAILTALAAMVAMALHWQARATQKMVDRRAASQAAEQVLIDLSRGIKPPADSPSLHVEKLTGGSVITGYAWVRVTSVFHGQTVMLTGLARTPALEKA